MSETIADDLRSEAVEALRLLGSTKDDYDREEYLLSLLKVIFQRGEIAAGDRDIAKNERTLGLISRLTSQVKDLTEALTKIDEAASVGFREGDFIDLLNYISNTARSVIEAEIKGK